jgi:UDP-2,3-diacylglucosamine hydrolase
VFPQVDAITLPKGKKIYFASDFHLGIPDAATSLIREKLICAWLDEIKKDAYQIFLLGDIFDAWLEYKTAVPKGFVRLLGKLAQLTDSGIKITAFTGNHDLWMYGYFEQELNIPVYHHPICIRINNQQFVLGHGDGLGPGDAGYKRLKKFLNNKACQWLYQWIHPDIGIRIAQYFSEKGLDKKQTEDTFLGEHKEFLILFCKDYLQQQHADYFLFGHRHYKLCFALNETSTYINLGDWLQYNSYAVYDGLVCSLETYNPNK